MRSSWFVSREDSTRCLVDSWDAISCFAATFVVPDRAFLLHGMAAAIGHSNFLLAFLSFIVILVIGINEVKSLPSSSIAEFWLLVFPFLFVSILCGFPNFRPYFWPYMIWSGSRLNFFSISPGPHIPLGGFSFNRVNLVKTIHESDKLVFESTFQQSSTRFSCMTSRSVWEDLVTIMHFSGTGNMKSSCFVWSKLPLRWFFEERFLMRPFFQFLDIRNHNVSFPNSTAIISYPRKIPGKNFLPNWWSLDWSRVEIDWYSTIAPKGIIGRLNHSPNRLSHGVVPTTRRSWDISQIAIAFHCIESAHHFSSNPDCSNTAEVPSFTRRTALSGMPFVSDRWGLEVRWFPWWSFTGFSKLQWSV